MGSTAMSVFGGDPSPMRSPLKSMGALSFSPSPMITTPSMAILESTMRMALTAAPSAPSLSPRPIHRDAAMAASRWMGRGDKEGADGAAVNAMRIVLSSIAMDGVVIIGEGEKDNAPMLFNGERIGDGSPPKTDIAVDTIDGPTQTALGRGGALAVIAASERGTMFDPGPCVYMESWQWARRRWVPSTSPPRLVKT